MPGIIGPGSGHGNRRHPRLIAEVRGAGLMLGLRIVPEVPNGTLIAALLDAGLVTIPAGDNVVRLLPPLIIGETQVEEAVAILDRVFTELRP